MRDRAKFSEEDERNDGQIAKSDSPRRGEPGSRTLHVQLLLFSSLGRSVVSFVAAVSLAANESQSCCAYRGMTQMEQKCIPVYASRDSFVSTAARRENSLVCASPVSVRRVENSRVERVKENEKKKKAGKQELTERRAMYAPNTENA